MARRIGSLSLAVMICFGGSVLSVPKSAAQANPDWPQWSRTPQHNGSTPAVGQSPDRQLEDITFDPFVNQEKAEGLGELFIHYQAPLVDRNHVFLEFKTGTYVSCDPPGSGQPYPCGFDAWNKEIWNERAFTWQNGSLVKLWDFRSDWKPEPDSGAGGNGEGLFGWEPVFHAAIWNGFVFVPGFSGSIYKLNESDGKVVAHYRPFGSDPNTFVSGPLTVDHKGNVYYNVLVLDGTDPWLVDARGAYLTKLSAQGTATKVRFSTLVHGTTDCGDPVAYGLQRPGINVAPALSNDGQTIYTVSRGHFDPGHACILAATTDLKSKWHTSLITSTITGYVSDLASSSPSVAPDGSVLFGVLSMDSSRGNLMKFKSSGKFLTSYDFGWDETPAVYAHDGTYSVIIKDNHYESDGPYYITQLNAQLIPEWQYQSPTNREWCVNAPAVDSTGTVYVNSEDGYVYVLNQGGSLKGKIFLREALGAAYTPIALGRDGKIYTENDGDMFVEGK